MILGRGNRIGIGELYSLTMPPRQRLKDPIMKATIALLALLSLNPVMAAAQATAASPPSRRVTTP